MVLLIVEAVNRLCFLEHRTLVSAYRLHLFHPPLDGRLCEECPLLEFLENAGPFVLLLETPNCLIDRFVVTDDNADQKIHLLTVV